MSLDDQTLSVPSVARFLANPGVSETAARVAVAGAVPAPDFGPTAVDARLGICCVGATPHVLNFNVLLATADLAVSPLALRSWNFLF